MRSRSAPAVVAWCSITFPPVGPLDEAPSVSVDVQDVAWQWPLIAESLRKSGHSQGSHGRASLFRAAGNVSVHHNDWAYHSARNPRLGDNYGSGEPVFDVRHALVYNWVALCRQGGRGASG